MKLTEILNKHLSKEEPFAPKERMFKIRPSSVGSSCLRKVFYSSTNTQEDYPFDLSSKKRMIIGDALHHKLSEIFRKAGIGIDYVNPDGSTNKDRDGNDDHEFIISSEDLSIKKGKIDLVSIIDGELWLGEYKSINNKGFAALDSPKSDHLIQGVIYLYLFNQMLKDGKYSHIPKLQGFQDAKGVNFFYMNKDNSEIKEFQITEASEVFRQIIKKILLVKQHFQEDKLPDKTWDFCTTCQFREKCKNNKLF